MDERLRVRFRRRLRLAGLLGLLGGLVLCLDLEAAAPTARSPFAWKRPAAPNLVAARSAPPKTTPETERQVAADRTLAGLAGSLDLGAARAQGDRLVQTLADGRQAVFTLDVRAQRNIEELLRRSEVPFGAVVALDPRTGDIRALVEVAHANRSLRGLARKAIAPSASVFKIVTAAALVEDAGVDPSIQVCYHGGMNGFSAAHLRDDPARDTRCESLSEGLARSSNVVLGKLADRGLDLPTLRRRAEAFGYERALPFLWPVELSPARIPSDRLERARAAAGFWHTHLSPLHAALIAAGVANEGVMMRPRLVRAVHDAQGRPAADLPDPLPWLRAMKPETAAALTTMMEGTVAFGTGSRAFAENKRPAALAGMRIAGKTGSLSSKGEERFHFSWFVGFAPADDPQVAIAVLMVNRPAWRLKAATAARQALGWLLEAPAEVEEPEDQPAAKAPAAAPAAAAPAEVRSPPVEAAPVEAPSPSDADPAW